MNHDHEPDTAEHAERIEHLRHTHAIVGDSSFSQLVQAFHREFGDVVQGGYPVCEEMIDWLREQGHMGGPRSAAQAGLPQWVAKFHKVLRYLKKHPTSNAIYAVIDIWDEPVLDAINGNMNQQQFADSIGQTKASVNNACMDAQKHFGTPPRKDRRQDAARQRMSEVRIERLEGGPAAPATK